jgi:hypothetical protein
MQPHQRRNKANFSSQLARQYCGQYVGWVEVIIEREVCEILNGFWEIIFQFRCNGLILFSKCLIIRKKFNVYIK